ncbi:MAG: calcineurin-like phosphoesterase C-terminal domain-containing protein [Bacteroidales bacterium]|nr:calcineurin-like phosphoesterase C-terminal domain-containing protein [Bacteroidales bacterium]
MKRIIAFTAALLMICGVAQARKVSGKVVSGKEKLSGVIVTDGEHFTKTKKSGKFVFDINDDAEFVYIVTPAGYVAEWSSGVPAFYQKAEGSKKFVFDLKKTDSSKDYTIVAIADPQVKTPEHFSMFAGKPMDDLVQTTTGLDGLSVGLALGDICWDEFDRIDDYKSEILRTGIPFYPVAGNHDHDPAASEDLAAIAQYRQRLGPENYAFFLGNDVVIVIDNVIFGARGRSEEGYADHVLKWVKGLERQIPFSSELYIAQHCPLRNSSSNAKIKNANDLLEIVRGHKVTFISGHAHFNNVLQYESNITEHNVASICGAWWDTDYCADGTPAGYKVFTKNNGRLSWYYKSVGYDKNYQVEVYKPGQTRRHPNSIVLNVWDWDPDWKVEWFEDGKPMGRLKPAHDSSPVYTMKINEALAGQRIPPYKRPALSQHYFAATPSQYAKHVTVSVENPFGKSWVYDVDMSECVDVQAHRGGAGLMSENTVEAVKRALDLGVNTLELDLQVSKDGLIVVSHDPYLHYRYAIRPDGSYVEKDDTKEYIYKMPYSEIAKYDVGSRPSEVWPDKECVKAVMPLANDLIDFVEKYTEEKGLSPVRYNIEIKSKDAAGEGQNWPTYDRFVTECCKFLHSKQLDDRLVVQSFDVRALNYLHEKYPEMNVSYLVDEDAPDFDTYMGYLKFTPQWLSPHHSITDEALVQKCREKGIKIVPWTVDEPEDIKRILDLGVDAIISNYPDRVLMQTRGY